MDPASHKIIDQAIDKSIATTNSRADKASLPGSYLPASAGEERID